jgi:outer membrane protein OmpA-like peptidoglycan-associated protein
MFTLRLGFSVFNSKRSYNEPRHKPTPRREEPKVISTVPTGKFSDVAINRPVTLQNIYFELTKADLLPQSNAELDEVVQWMRQNPNVSIRLEGHTDKIGDADKNLQLSRERVNAVREYLMVKGISGMRIEVKGYGDTRLVCPSPCERNRRVEMVITKR